MIWLLIAGGLVSEIVGTIGGFGSATLFTGFAALFLDIKSAIAVIAVFHLAGAIARGAYFFRKINWRLFGWFMATDAAFTFAGALAIGAAPESAVRLTFGIFLLLYGFWSLFSERKVSLPQNKIFLLVGGGLSGLLAGLLGTGGAARAAALRIFNEPKESYLGTSAAMAVLTDIIRIPVYVSYGLLSFTAATISLSGGLAVAAILGASLGVKIADKLPENVFGKIVAVLLAVAGIYFILL